MLRSAGRWWPARVLGAGGFRHDEIGRGFGCAPVLSGCSGWPASGGSGECPGAPVRRVSGWVCPVAPGAPVRALRGLRSGCTGRPSGDCPGDAKRPRPVDRGRVVRVLVVRVLWAAAWPPAEHERDGTGAEHA